MASRFFGQLVRFSVEHTRLYISLCVSAGLMIRWYMAGGDMSLWLNPLFPVFVH